jgi:endonuclease YncB( thermonuclease family)
MNKIQEKNYQELVQELSALYESTLLMGVEAQRQHRVRTYWKMGRRMADAALGEKGRAQYGENVMERISADLTSRYGKGFRARNAYYMRDFARAFSEETILPELNWNHYKALMSIPDAALREKMTALLEASPMPAKQFQSLVRDALAGEKNSTGTGFDLKTLFVPRKGRPGIYRVRQDDFGRRRFFLDLGFNVVVPVTLRMMPPDVADGDMVCVKEPPAFPDTAGTESTGASMTGVKFQQVSCGAGERYCYNGTLLRVVDGDTVIARVSLGFGVWVNERFRLRGVAAPELPTSRGEEAMTFARNLMPAGTAVKILTYHRDRYGRWVADVFGGARRERLLNLEMVESGVARYVAMSE